MDKLWLDVVLVVDNSKNMGKSSLKKVSREALLLNSPPLTIGISFSVHFGVI